jgi:hypothetical protein
MGIAEKVAKMRLCYHANLIELNNILNQLNIRSDNVAEEIAAKHVMILFNDVLPRIYGEEAINRLMESKTKKCP